METMRIRKETGGNSIRWHGTEYEWPVDDPVCEVPAELGRELLAILGGGCSLDPDPEPEDDGDEGESGADGGQGDGESGADDEDGEGESSDGETPKQTRSRRKPAGDAAS